MKSVKLLFVIILLLLFAESKSQSIPTLEPNPVVELALDFSEAFINKFNSPEAFEDCEKVYNNMEAEGRTWKQLTQTELEILKYCDETKEDVWEIGGSGCSWYCGGEIKSVTASSYLKSQGSNNYEPINAHDFSFKNVWAEGVDGYGVGEYLTYYFNPECPRITEIIVVNGYVKNQTAWQNNSRVKKIRIYYNDIPLADLNLKDVRAEQHFKIGPIGNSDRANMDELKLKDQWTLRFQILEVYKGLKYSDTVISEIYFDGIDVH